MMIQGRAFALISLLVGPLVTAATADEAANEALARSFYAAMNERNLDALDAIVATDFVDHNAPPGAQQGIAGLKAGLQPFLDSSSDLKVVNEMVIVKGDYVTVVDMATGTNDGVMMGMAATNKPFQFRAIDLWLVKDDKLAEVWHVEELLQMMMQIGAMGGGQ